MRKKKLRFKRLVRNSITRKKYAFSRDAKTILGMILVTELLKFVNRQVSENGKDLILGVKE